MLTSASRALSNSPANKNGPVKGIAATAGVGMRRPKPRASRAKPRRWRQARNTTRAIWSKRSSSTARIKLNVDSRSSEHISSASARFKMSCRDTEYTDRRRAIRAARDTLDQVRSADRKEADCSPVGLDPLNEEARARRAGECLGIVK